MHSGKCAQAVTCKIGKQVPVIPEIGDYNTCRKQPDTGFSNPYPAGKVCMSAINIDCPDRFKAGLNDTSDEDNEG
jgi:hypothetical protein